MGPLSCLQQEHRQNPLNRQIAGLAAPRLGYAAALSGIPHQRLPWRI